MARLDADGSHLPVLPLHRRHHHRALAQRAARDPAPRRADHPLRPAAERLPVLSPRHAALLRRAAAHRRRLHRRGAACALRLAQNDDRHRDRHPGRLLGDSDARPARAAGRHRRGEDRSRRARAESHLESGQNVGSRRTAVDDSRRRDGAPWRARDAMGPRAGSQEVDHRRCRGACDRTCSGTSSSRSTRTSGPAPMSSSPPASPA